MDKKLELKESEWTSDNFWTRLRVYWLPNKCFLCGRWKLWGMNPHKKCVEQELRMDNDMDIIKEKYAEN